jgi:hypothetical protein
MMSHGGRVGNSTRTLLASGAKNNLAISVVTLNDGLMKRSHSSNSIHDHDGGRGYVAPTHNEHRPTPAATLAATKSLIDQDEFDNVSNAAAPAVDQVYGPRIIGSAGNSDVDGPRRHPLMSYSEDLSEDGRGNIESSLTPVLSNISSFDHSSTGQLGNSSFVEPRQRLSNLIRPLESFNEHAVADIVAAHAENNTNTANDNTVINNEETAGS